MARETKVGLIAGLAFIICFAVILANRGQKPKPTAHRPYVVDRGVDPTPNLDPPRSPVSPPRGAARQASRSTQPAVTRTTRAEPPASGSQVVFQDPQGSPDSATAGPADSNGVEDSSETSRSALAEATDGDQVGADVDTTRVLTSRDDLEARRRLLQEQLDALTAQTDAARNTQPSTTPQRPAPMRVQDENGAPGPAASGRKPAPTRVDRPLGTHTVAAGDNLSKIAQRYYGSRSKQVVDAIFQANRSALSSPDMVRVGMEIVLPAIESAEVTAVRPGAPAASERPPSDRQKAAPSQATFRWYQIQKNDRYIEIARRELGDPDRWREIYELNKDKFPDPQMIREGVRIKLPATSVADSAGGRR